MKKIAIIRLSSIGDIVLSTPLIRSLRNKYPESRIDFIVKNEYAELLSTNLHLNNVISFD
ncbi:glycosyl transferase, partial [candidate division KSB1 bacterium]|nr:glycosyl transferase [candidate division KSB1 bacterium]